MSTLSEVVTVERTIPAPAASIFALISDAGRHPEIDGSGTVIAAKGTSEPLRLGSTFGMSMRMKVPYSMASTVIEYTPDRLIAWQTRGPGRVGAHVGGRIWRYELEPTEGGTLVRESWDITAESVLTKRLVRGAAEVTRRNMAATLARIEEIVTA